MTEEHGCHRWGHWPNPDTGRCTRCQEPEATPGPTVTVTPVWPDARFRRAYGFTVRADWQVCMPRFADEDEARRARRRVLRELRRRGFRVEAAS